MLGCNRENGSHAQECGNQRKYFIPRSFVYKLAFSPLHIEPSEYCWMSKEEKEHREAEQAENKAKDAHAFSKFIANKKKEDVNTECLLSNGSEIGAVCMNIINEREQKKQRKRKASVEKNANNKKQKREPQEVTETVHSESQLVDELASVHQNRKQGPDKQEQGQQTPSSQSPDRIVDFSDDLD